jgi:hypothetical protein
MKPPPAPEIPGNIEAERMDNGAGSEEAGKKDIVR